MNADAIEALEKLAPMTWQEVAAYLGEHGEAPIGWVIAELHNLPQEVMVTDWLPIIHNGKASGCYRKDYER